MSSITRRPNCQWRARYRDAGGKEHARHFGRKVDAQRWLDEVTAGMVTGRYIDPGAGRITFKAYAEQWRSQQMHRPSTADQVERRLRLHVYPLIGDRPLESLRPDDLQKMVKLLQDDLSPATVGVTFRYVSSVLKAAVASRRLHESPCLGVRLPQVNKERVEPIATEMVIAIAETVPARYRGLVLVAAGTGMRQGEVFGLTVDRVDFLRRTITVDRQLVGIQGADPFFGPPKTRASVRTIPLPTAVGETLARHMEAFPANVDGLIFTGAAGQRLRRSGFGDMWRKATSAAGADGLVFHHLRHYYASLLIRHGESVKVVQERLGHASAQETLDTYSHLWPDADDQTRAAVDGVLGAALADSVRTGAVSS